MLLSMSNGINYGYLRSLAGMLGASFGNLILVAWTAVGIGVILDYQDSIFPILKWFGILYLSYLGGKEFFKKQDSGLGKLDNQHLSGTKKIFLRAFFVSLSNPKGLIYFIALFPQFVVPNESIVLQFSVLTLTFLVTDFLWMSIYAKGGTILANWLNAGGHGRKMRHLSAMLLIIAAIVLAFSS